MPDYSDEELKKFGFSPDDFCGPPGLTTGQGDPFAWQCAKHDHDFVQLKNGDPALLARVDADFLRNMINHIRNTGRWGLYPRALLYYSIVRATGWYWWRKKPR